MSESFKHQRRYHQSYTARGQQNSSAHLKKFPVKQKPRHNTATATSSIVTPQPQWVASMPKSQPEMRQTATTSNHRQTLAKQKHSARAVSRRQNLSRQSKSSQTKTKKSFSKPKSAASVSKNYHPLLFVFRTLVVLVGISTIFGTVLSLANSTNSTLMSEATSPVKEVQTATEQNEEQLKKHFSSVFLGQELIPLKDKIETLAAKYPQLQPEVLLVDLDDHNYVSLAAKNSISAASTIKLPILVAFFQEVDAGRIELTEKLKMTEDVIAGGSGTMQYLEPGTQFTALETADKMITISDNTATNMLIERLGGAKVLNQKFYQWGLTATAIRNPLPDLTGTNTTSPEDLGNLLAKIEAGELISLRSRDRLLQIMRDTRTNTLLPQGLGPEATIAHKTGDIKSVLGDVGIVDLPNGKRYIASVLVKRPDNDPAAKQLIQQISQAAYQYFVGQRTNPFNENSMTE